MCRKGPGRSAPVQEDGQELAHRLAREPLLHGHRHESMVLVEGSRLLGAEIVLLAVNRHVPDVMACY